MKAMTILISTGVLGLVCTGQAFAQPARQHELKRVPELHLWKHEKIIGAAVTNGQTGEAMQKLGTIADLVVDGKTGSVDRAVLALGEKQVLVKWDSLDPVEKKAEFRLAFRLAMTRDALQRLPAFDPEQLHMAGDDGAVSSPKGYKKAQEATTKKVAGRRLLASTLSDIPVLARGDKLGSPGALHLEPKSGAIAFLTVSVGGVVGIGGSNHVIPWNAVKLTRSIGGGNQARITIDKSKKAMEQAPKLEDEKADLADPRFRKTVYEFYGVQPPKFDAALQKGFGRRIGQ